MNKRNVVLCKHCIYWAYQETTMSSVGKCVIWDKPTWPKGYCHMGEERI